MRQALSNPPGALDPGVVNSDRWRRAEVPAVNGHGTARSVAGLYVALREGRLLSAGLTEEMTSVAASGVDQVLGEPAEWGLGVALDVDGFGMGGVGGSFGWWSTEGDYAIGFVTGGSPTTTGPPASTTPCGRAWISRPCRPPHRTMASRSGERDRSAERPEHRPRARPSLSIPRRGRPLGACALIATNRMSTRPLTTPR